MNAVLRLKLLVAIAAVALPAHGQTRPAAKAGAVPVIALKRMAAPDLDTLTLGATFNALFTTGNNILVADKPENRIFEFDASGKFVRTIGRKGRGPGEFTDLSKVAALTDNRIAVMDQSLRRISIFDAKRALERTIPLKVRLAYCCTTTGEYLERDTITANQAADTMSMRFTISGADAVPTASSVELKFRPHSIVASAKSLGNGLSEATGFHLLPFLPSPFIEMGDGIIASYGATFDEIVVHNSAGKLTQTIKSTARAIPIPSVIRTAAIDSILDMEKEPATKSALRSAFRSAALPATFPLILRGRVYGNAVWLQQFSADGQPESWIRHTPDGTRAEVQLARNERALAFSKTALLAVFENAESGEQNLRLYQFALRP